MNEQQTVPMDHEETREREVPDESIHEPDADVRLVPVSESKKYRRRAQAAEKLLEEMRSELAEATLKLEHRDQAIADLERQRTIDECLLEADAIDLEAARMLTELSLAEMETPDPGQAVVDLQRRRPYLFRHRSRTNGSLSPHPAGDSSPHAESLLNAAEQAGATGRRADLLRYLRLRRRGG